MGGRKKALDDYELMPEATPVSHSNVVALVRNRFLHGRGAGWVDAHLLASALAETIPLWTADSHLIALAEELGIAYRPL